MEGHAGQATDVRAVSALKRPIASARRALARLRPGARAAGRLADALPDAPPAPSAARPASVRALREEHRAGTLNSPERIERAAERLLGG